MESRLVLSEFDLLDEILGVVTQLPEDSLPDLTVGIAVEQHVLVACVTSSNQHTKRQAPSG